MREELSEKVETVYADVYVYPLGLAILLLVAEVFVGEAPTRVFVRERRRRRARRRRSSRARRARRARRRSVRP